MQGGEVLSFQRPNSRATLGRVKIFEKLRLWVDPVLRPGPEAMAVDEWLLETAEAPVLRVYGWAGAWASVGYFGEVTAAREAFPGVDLVRRWTGGGMVDHRADWTYTVVMHRGEPLANSRGAESYRRIHAALAETLAEEGIPVRMSAGDEETGAALCFENPVGYDLVARDGRKLAGAGQRRSRCGLLHQGSVVANCRDFSASEKRAEDLAESMAVAWERVIIRPDPEELVQRSARYASPGWVGRR